MKAYTYITIFFNVLLIPTLFHTIFNEMYLYDYEKDIENTMELSSQILVNHNDAIIENTNELLVYKPLLNEPINHFFQKNNQLINCFLPKIESLIQQPSISNQAMQSIAIEWENIRTEHKSLYYELYSHKDILKDRRYKQRDIAEKKKNINSRYSRFPSYKDLKLDDSSQKEKKLILQTIRLYLQNIQSYFNQEVERLSSGGRGIRCCFGYGYPFVQTSTSVTQMGKPHKIELYGFPLSGCSHLPAKIKNRTSIFWDGVRVEEKTFKQKIKNTGFQKHEAVVLWVDENDQIQSDTSHFQFYVKP